MFIFYQNSGSLAISLWSSIRTWWWRRIFLAAAMAHVQTYMIIRIHIHARCVWKRVHIHAAHGHTHKFAATYQGYKLATTTKHCCLNASHTFAANTWCTHARTHAHARTRKHAHTRTHMWTHMTQHGKADTSPFALWPQSVRTVSFSTHVWNLKAYVHM